VGYEHRLVCVGAGSRTPLERNERGVGEMGRHGNSSQLACTTNGATWATSFRGVWHLNETMSDEATTGTNRDSTANLNHGAQGGNDDVAGTVAGGQDFDGANDGIDCGNSASLSISNNLTMEMWINPDTLSLWDYFCGRTGSGWDGWGFLIASGTSLRFIIDYYSYSDAYVQTSQFYTNQWQHFVGVYDGSASPRTLRLYRNGSQVAGISNATQIDTPTSHLFLGNMGNSNSYNTDGKLDEIRVSNVARSADWVWASFMSQGSNTVFNSYGTVATEQGNGLFFFLR